MTSKTHTLALPDVDLVYDVHGPIPTADGRPVLFMIGQPMCADGFARPRGPVPRPHRRHLRPARSRPQQRAPRRARRPDAAGPGRRPARAGAAPGAGQGRRVRQQRRCRRRSDLGASATPTTSPPCSRTSRRRRGRSRTTPRPPTAPSRRCVRLTRTRASARAWPGSWGCRCGRASSATTTSPSRRADPAMFGMPTDDDGSRDDMLLSDRAVTVTRYAYDIDAIKASPARVVHRRRRGDRRLAARAHRPGRRRPPRQRTGRLPQPPRRLRRRRPREPVRRQAGRVRRHAPPGARRLLSPAVATSREDVRRGSRTAGHDQQPHRRVDHAGQRVGEVVGAEVEPGHQGGERAAGAAPGPSHRAARK